MMHLRRERVTGMRMVRMVLEVMTIRNIGVFEVVLTGVGNHFRR